MNFWISGHFSVSIIYMFILLKKTFIIGKINRIILIQLLNVITKEKTIKTYERQKLNLLKAFLLI